jgi:hypothetical protein
VNIEFERAVQLVENSVPTEEKGRAIHEWLTQIPNRATPQQTLREGDPQSVEESQAYAARRTSELREIRRVLDAVSVGHERLAAYDVLATEFTNCVAKEDAASAYKKLATEVAKTNSRWARVKEWFAPLLNRQFALLVCGLMALTVYMLKPTAEIFARAIAYRFHERSENPHVQRALAQFDAKAGREPPGRSTPKGSSVSTSAASARPR